MFGHPVMPRQPLVDERIVGAEQIDDVAVVPDDALEEHARSRARTPAAGCRRNPGRPRSSAARVRTLRSCSHCPAKLLTSARDTGIRQHPADLPLAHGRILQPPARRRLQQLVVRDAAPEKEGQARRQLDVADAIHRARRQVRRVGLDPEHEVGTRQDELQRRLNAGLERSRRAAPPRRTAARARCRRPSAAGDTRGAPATR